MEWGWATFSGACATPHALRLILISFQFSDILSLQSRPCAYKNEHNDEWNLWRVVWRVVCRVDQRWLLRQRRRRRRRRRRPSQPGRLGNRRRAHSQVKKLRISRDSLVCARVPNQPDQPSYSSTRQTQVTHSTLVTETVAGRRNDSTFQNLFPPICAPPPSSSCVYMRSKRQCGWLIRLLQQTDIAFLFKKFSSIKNGFSSFPFFLLIKFGFSIFYSKVKKKKKSVGAPCCAGAVNNSSTLTACQESNMAPSPISGS